jgi:hypothetical protein
MGPSVGPLIGTSIGARLVPLIGAQGVTRLALCWGRRLAQGTEPWAALGVVSRSGGSARAGETVKVEVMER